jgi:hypothetical protein
VTAWIDELRTDSHVRVRLDLGPVSVEIRGAKNATDLQWRWQWWLPDAHEVRTAPDEAGAKIAAIAAMDAWIAEIVEARAGMVSP